MPTSPGVLSLRALNRALLSRQLLLRPAPMPGTGIRNGPARAERVIETVEHLVGLQAQAPFPPYYGLWSRLAGFRPDDLAELILSRRVVRIALMRGTIHLVSARDCLMLRPLVQPALDRGLGTLLSRPLAGVDTAALAAAGRVLVEERPLTFSELGAALSPRWPRHPPAALAQGVRALVPLVQVPPRAVWGAAGLAAHTSAEAWLGREMEPSPALGRLVTRYLAAFGPASVLDVQAWSGLTRLREVVDRLRPGLRVFRDERGAELFDLPDAPRPDPDTPVPPRFLPEFDNLILSHADRTRCISAEHRARVQQIRELRTFLVDGVVRGGWRIARQPGAATLLVEPYEPLSGPDAGALLAEAERLLAFVADGPV